MGNRTALNTLLKTMKQAFLRRSLSGKVEKVVSDSTCVLAKKTSLQLHVGQAINPEDVIKWLVTQPNANGTLYLETVARQYMYTVRSAPKKLNIPHGFAFRNVFTYNTPEMLNACWNVFKCAPNYKQVNIATSGGFSAGMACFLRYLQHVTMDIPPMKKTDSSDTPNNSSIDSETIKKLTDILSKRFSNGYRVDSPIELARFRRFFANEWCEETTLSDDELEKLLASCGTSFKGKVYVVSDQSKEQIRNLAENYFADGAQAIFYAELYAKNENWLFDACVISEDMLTDILHVLFPKLSFTQTYFGYTDTSASAILESEILRVWGGDVLLTYKQLAERLQYIPIERIKSALAQNGDFIWNSVETFSHINQINVTEIEREKIHKIVVQRCNARGYVSVTDLPLDEIEGNNDQLSVSAIHNAVYRICLPDEFDKKGKIITRKGDIFDALTIMKDYCRSLDKCSLDDLLKFEKELTGEVHRWVPMEAGNAILVRADKDVYIADRYLHFDTDVIDDAIGLFVESDYIPLKTFTTFGAFPDCGQKWNLFLLESYCRRFSRQFRFAVLSVNSVNAGVIVKRDSPLILGHKNATYAYENNILPDAIATANIPLAKASVLEFLYNEGYIGRRSYSKVDDIIEKAKSIREMRD